MKPVDQTRTGPAGNCMLACWASILEVDIDELPDIYLAHRRGDSWINVINTYLVKHHRLVYVETQPVYTPYIVPAWEAGFHVVNGPSPRGTPEGHACVGRAGRIVFDPSPDRAGVASIDSYGLLVPATQWHVDNYSWPCECRSCSEAV